MTGFLKYRAPGNKVVSLKGGFKPVDSFMDVNGFIISSYDKSKRFVFEEGILTEPKQEGVLPVVYTQDEYESLAKAFLNGIIEKDLGKAIFSRVKKVPFEMEKGMVFDQLCSAYPNAFIYHFFSPEVGEWMGATPETLVQVENGLGRTMSLAGTLPLESDKDWTSKEKVEQAYVTEFISESLKNQQVSGIEVSDLSELVAGPVKHLVTHFSFELEASQIVGLMDDLHPTPAVSGLPRIKAMNWIDESEKHDRALYAGMIGCLSESNAHVYVNLRCMQLVDNEAYLYLGGGFTAKSNVQKEWEETENKARTLLNIMENL